MAIMIGAPNGAPHPTHPKYRADIDGLRGIAVLSVVGYHAFRSYIRGGFIGVDIFFVISGFLISSIIFENLKKDSFSFVDFYIRRVRRIFPALLLVLLACFAIGWLVLLPDEYKQLGKQIAGGAGFVSNLVLWNESGYFDNNSATKPLLHLWSLAIEEQYYIFWPLLSWFAWKRRVNLLGVTVVVALISFAFNIAKVFSDPVAVFYSPQTRIWELLIGSSLAYLMLNNRISFADQKNNLANVRAFAGASLIAVGLVAITGERAFPGWWALLPTVGTALIISAGAQAWLNRSVLANPVLIWFGLISYPLYLWHWPLLSFAQIVRNDIPSSAIRGVAVLASIALAWLTYRLVEKPLRFGQYKVAKAISLVASMIVLGCLGYECFHANGLSSRRIAKATYELSNAKNDWSYKTPSIEGKMTDDTNKFVGVSPQSILFIGDSTMAQYYARVVKLYADKKQLPYFSTFFAAKPGCRPIPHGEKVNSKNYGCDAYYSAIMNLAKDPIYSKIVISANWETVLSDSVAAENLPEFTSDIHALRQSGKPIIFISVQPHSKLMDPLALAKPSLRLNPFDDGSNIPKELWRDRSSLENQDKHVALRLNEFANQVGATVINPFDYFCTKVKCPVVIDGKPLYRDDYHYRASATRDYATFIDGIVNQ